MEVPRTVLLLACALAAAACGSLSPARRSYLADLVEVETAQARGRHGEAVALANRMLARPMDEGLRCPVLHARARALVGLGRRQAALDAFDETRRACVSMPDVSAAALLDLAIAVQSWSAHPAAGLPHLRAVVLRFPDAPAAKRAVVRIEDALARAGGADAVVEELRRLYRVVARSEVGPYLLYEAAGVLRREAEGRGPDDPLAWRSLALYDLLIRRHPESALRDDALIASAALASRVGRHWDAVRFYKAILAERETSWFFGSYDTPVQREAARALGEAERRARSSGGAR